MPYFELKQEIYHILSFLVVPIISCFSIYKIKPKIIWITPIVILVLFMIVTAIFYPYYFTDAFKKDYDFTTIYWFIFIIPLQIVSSLLYTGITYLIIKKRRKNINKL